MAVTPDAVRMHEEEYHQHRPMAAATAIIVSGSGQIASGRYVLLGWSVRETTGAAAAALRLRDGQSAAGGLVASIAVAAGAHQSQWLGDDGVLVNVGVFLEMVSGTVEGAVYVRAEARR